jgi:ubiquinol-cytochrome c reductase cytochrome b subunit
MLTKIKNWLDVRIGLNTIFQTHDIDYRMPKNTNILYTLGFLSVIAYVVQAFTGIVLLIYYIPHPDHAFGSVQDIMSQVPYGWLFRQMHAVGSNLMLGGVLLLILTLIFGLSGYLLPWTQLSYWSTTVVTSIPTAFPVIGETISHILRGGGHVSSTTLSRFFALHISILPPLFLLFMGLHLFLVNRIGISATPFGKADEEKRPLTEYKRKSHPDGYPYYPLFFQKQMYMMMAYFTVMFFIITFFPNLYFHDEANIPADPFNTPHNIRPAWFLLAPYQLLKLIPNKFFGIMLQIFLVFVIVLWPFLDTQQEKNVLKRPVLRGVFLFLMISWVVLSWWGRS